MAKDLTAATVRNAVAKPPKRKPDGEAVRTEIPDGKCRGLFLVVQTNGTKSWALRYRFDGKPKKLTIGPTLDVREVPVADLPHGEPHTLAEARVAADRARLEVADVDDPPLARARAAFRLDRLLSDVRPVCAGQSRWPRWCSLRAFQTHRRHRMCQCNLRSIARLDRPIVPSTRSCKFDYGQQWQLPCQLASWGPIP